jgi:two-component system response regulator NreC
MDPRLTDLLVEEVRRSGEEPTDPLETLSEREREILVLLAQGKSYQEIAQTLFISVKTVDFHRANLMRKLGLKNRAELVQFAMRRGLI